MTNLNCEQLDDIAIEDEDEDETAAKSAVHGDLTAVKSENEPSLSASLLPSNRILQSRSISLPPNGNFLCDSLHFIEISANDKSRHNNELNFIYDLSKSSQPLSKITMSDSNMNQKIDLQPISDNRRLEMQDPNFQGRLSLEKLLEIIYDDCKKSNNVETDSNTEYSLLSDSSSLHNPTRFTEHELWQIDTSELQRLAESIKAEIEYENDKLIKALRRKLNYQNKQQSNCDIITAVLQAISFFCLAINSKLRFSLAPSKNNYGYDEWISAMKAVVRLPDGIPANFRKELWLVLANHHIKEMGIDWGHTSQIAFNDKMNPDDDRLSLQIIKDLHRTGWTGLNGDDEKIRLKRLLLGYARFNKSIGYCQGLNVIGALVLEITEFKEESALKVMIFLIEHILPRGYFDQTLRALSVDLIVLRDLLYQRLPKTKLHLDNLQKKSEFEPPLTNVFSMQWFLTLFATCLPKRCVYRIWDALMLEGSEILLRTSLVIWAKLSKRILKTKTVDEFYTLMCSLSKCIMCMKTTEINNFIEIIYAVSEFPYLELHALRERYTWNVQPFGNTFSMVQKQVNSILHISDEDLSDNEQAMHTAAYQHGQRYSDRTNEEYKVVVCGGLFSINLSSLNTFNHLLIRSLLELNEKSIFPSNFVSMNGSAPVTPIVVQPFETDYAMESLQNVLQMISQKSKVKSKGLPKQMVLHKSKLILKSFNLSKNAPIISSENPFPVPKKRITTKKLDMAATASLGSI
ncbi:unnamed protein product [Dracunculus medinensis]|uniref:Rab-GAP TBC domain-containing protein n=1 Tax=Dracunculus medinensis TaxID=318479 RepID=A0A158Q3K6_DRAME|nr:unnamed protein product [Dracunculus medinensis]